MKISELARELYQVYYGGNPLTLWEERDIECLAFWFRLAEHVQKIIEEETDKQYSQMTSDINVKLNKQYRGELQDMQRQKNKIMAINIFLTKKKCADELEEAVKFDDNDSWAKRCVKIINKADNLIKKWRN